MSGQYNRLILVMIRGQIQLTLQGSNHNPELLLEAQTLRIHTHRRSKLDLLCSSPGLSHTSSKDGFQAISGEASKVASLSAASMHFVARGTCLVMLCDQENLRIRCAHINHDRYRLGKDSKGCLDWLPRFCALERIS